MSDSPFVHFYPSDWLAGTRGLTAAETGVYITLIAMMYESEGPIPDDRKRLARLCGATQSAFNSALEGLIETGKITHDERGFFNRRVEIEIEKRSEKRAAAIASANARWQKSVKKQEPRHATAKETQCENDANQIPDTRIRDTNVSQTRADAFAEFWDAYPKKVGKAAARKNFDRVVESGADPGAIIAGAKRYAGSDLVRRGFAKHPQGWLTDGRWEDEASPSRPVSPPDERQSFLKKIAGAAA